MTIEAQLGRIADLLETLVGVLATGGGAATTTATAPAPAAAASKPAAAKKTAKAPAPPPAAESQDDGLGGDDDGLGGDDDGLGGGEDAVSVEDAKAKVLEYRGAITKSKGKEEGLALTRKLLNKYVPELNAITDENAGTVHAAFVAALEALTKKK